MITCSVLRCTNFGSEFLAGRQGPDSSPTEAYVCAEHIGLINSGALWDMQGRDVLLGQDVAPALESWSVRQSAGSDGFTLTLELSGKIRPVELFLTPPQAVALAVSLAANSE
ncbi:conserved hypothetical protein [Arthrobacter sp. 9AX]|nr:conserved hypothetical protein [Arthrobacter sp. 9AX]